MPAYRFVFACGRSRGRCGCSSGRSRQGRDGTINRFLFSLLVDRQAPANPSRPDALGVRSVDVTVGASTGVRARVYFSSAPTPAETEPSPRPVIIYIHSGGFTYFSAATRPYDALCRETGAVVVSASYRLGPEHRFPTAYDDGEAALRYLATTGPPDEIPVRADLARCFLANDSAGASMHAGSSVRRPDPCPQMPC